MGQLLIPAGNKGPLQQLLITVSHIEPALLHTDFTHVPITQGIIHRLLDGIDRIYKGPVQVEYTAFIHYGYHSFPWIYVNLS